MRELGLDAFRFSIAWPRILPDGRGRGEPGGPRLLRPARRRAARAAASSRSPTLYHWDLPQALEDAGGWPARATAEAFVEYAEAVADAARRPRPPLDHAQRAVGRRVARLRRRASTRPGRTTRDDALAAAHHLLLSHGWAAEVIRRVAPGAEVGITLNLNHAYPASDSDADRDAARRGRRAFNRWFLDPLFGGELSRRHRRALRPGDSVGRRSRTATSRRSRRRPTSSASTTTRARCVRGDPNGGRPTVVRDPDASYTAMGWEVYPDGLLRPARARPRRLRPAADLHHRERRRVRRRTRRRRRACTIPSGRPTSTAHLDAIGRAIEAGVPMARLLRLVAARQLRVGGRATRSASASSTSTTRPSSACRRRATTGIATSSRRAGTGTGR